MVQKRKKSPASTKAGLRKGRHKSAPDIRPQAQSRQIRPKVFISYSHDSPYHIERVRRLANELCENDIDAVIDAYVSGIPAEGWSRWMESQIETSDRVLIVVTKQYNALYAGTVPKRSGRGNGVDFETSIIRDALLYEGAHGTFICVFLDQARPTLIPPSFRRFGWYANVSKRVGFRKLSATIEGDGTIVRPKRRDDKRFWIVPLPKNDNFVGREKYLEVIRRTLDKTRKIALYGTKGVGKTHLALEYAYTNQARYRAVFWVDAETNETRARSFDAIARHFKLDDVNSPTDQVVESVLDRLASTEGWLLVLDNVTEPGALGERFQTLASGDVIVTSPMNRIAGFTVRRVERMSPTEALLLLVTRSGYTTWPNARERTAAARLAKQVDYLPIMLDAIAAYVLNGTTFAAYDKDGLIKKPPETITRNVERVRKKSAAARGILVLSSFLNSDDIPFDFLLNGWKELGPDVVEALGKNERSRLLTELLLLETNGLITMAPDRGSYSVHRVVQDAVKGTLDDITRGIWIRRTVRALDKAFPGVTAQNWVLCSRLLPHVRVVAELVDRMGLTLQAAGHLLHEAAWYLYERADYENSERFNALALRIRRHRMDQAEREAAHTLTSMARLHRRQADYEAAETCYDEAWAIRKRALDEDDPDIAQSHNSLGSLYDRVGRYHAGMDRVQRAIAIYSACGPPREHADALANLSKIARHLGDYSAALEYARQAGDIMLKAAGPKSADYASMLIHEAKVCRARRDYARALELTDRATKILKGHPAVARPTYAIALNDLGVCCRLLGDHARAEAHHADALRIRRQMHPPNHPDIAQSLHDLGVLRGAQKNFDEAKKHLDDALAIQAAILPENHLVIAQTLANLAFVEFALGNHARARDHAMRSERIESEIHGENAPLRRGFYLIEDDRAP